MQETVSTQYTAMDLPGRLQAIRWVLQVLRTVNSQDDLKELSPALLSELREGCPFQLPDDEMKAFIEGTRRIAFFGEIF